MTELPPPWPPHLLLLAPASQLFAVPPLPRERPTGAPGSTARSSPASPRDTEDQRTGAARQHNDSAKPIGSLLSSRAVPETLHIMEAVRPTDLLVVETLLPT